MESKEAENFVDILRRRAREQPRRWAFSFLEDGEVESVRLDYAQLDLQARAIAADLQRRGLQGERILLLHSRPADFVPAFFGCLYAGAAAVPMPAPSPALLKHAAPRLKAILKDADAAAVLTCGRDIAGQREILKGPGGLSWIAGEAFAEDAAKAWRQPCIGPGTLAFLQYTSGSTADPMGVMITHENLCCNSRMQCSGMGVTERDIFVGWLPLQHDMGLGAQLLEPVYVGFPAVVMSPLSCLKRPVRWLRAITRYKATSTGAPSFGYDLCARKIDAQEMRGLDLSSLKLALNGADFVRVGVLERFARRFHACGFRSKAFYPCYGLAEATLMVSGGKRGDPWAVRRVDRAALEQGRVRSLAAKDPRARAVVDCGRSLPGESILIADPKRRIPCAEGSVGEVWVAGPHVAQGYWKRPGRTREVFGAFLRDRQGPFLRTGDLGFMEGGRLFIVGRIKDLILLRGVNIHPQDVEETAELAHPLLRRNACAAFGADVGEEERLVLVAELGSEYFRSARRTGKPSCFEIASAIRAKVFEGHRLRAHEVFLVRSGTIPRTTSGKLRRGACRSLYLEGKLMPIGGSRL